MSIESIYTRLTELVETLNKRHRDPKESLEAWERILIGLSDLTPMYGAELDPAKETVWRMIMNCNKRIKHQRVYKRKKQ